MPIATIQRLPNGLTVIVCRYPSREAVYLDLAIKAGSGFENQTSNGITHLAEHILQQQAIVDLRDHPWIKHYLNDTASAYTLEDRVNFECRVRPRDLDDAIKFLATAIANPTINVGEVAAQQKIILEELAGVEAETDYHWRQAVRRALYGRNPLGFEVLGSRATLARLTPALVRRHIRSRFQPGNAILTVVGNVRPHEVIQLINRWIPLHGSPVGRRRSLPPFRYPGDRLEFVCPDEPRGHLNLRLALPNRNAEENVRWEFFAEVLNNYLFYEIQGELNTYSIDVSMRTYSDSFVLTIEASLAPAKVATLYAALHEKLARFSDALGQTELRYYIQKKVATLALERDVPEEEANAIGWYVLNYGTEHALGLNEQRDIIRKITLADIHDRFRRLFSSSRGVLVAGGKLSAARRATIKRTWQSWQL